MPSEVLFPIVPTANIAGVQAVLAPAVSSSITSNSVVSGLRTLANGLYYLSGGFFSLTGGLSINTTVGFTNTLNILGGANFVGIIGSNFVHYGTTTWRGASTNEYQSGAAITFDAGSVVAVNGSLSLIGSQTTILDNGPINFSSPIGRGIVQNMAPVLGLNGGTPSVVAADGSHIAVANGDGVTKIPCHKVVNGATLHSFTAEYQTGFTPPTNAAGSMTLYKCSRGGAAIALASVNVPTGLAGLTPYTSSSIVSPTETIDDSTYEYYVLITAANQSINWWSQEINHTNITSLRSI